MSAMEPISTHDLRLDHEPIDDWQHVETTASVPVETTTAFAQLGSIAGVDYGLWEMSVGATSLHKLFIAPGEG